MPLVPQRFLRKGLLLPVLLPQGSLELLLPQGQEQPEPQVQPESLLRALQRELESLLQPSESQERPEPSLLHPLPRL